MVEVISFGEPMVEFCATSVGHLKDAPMFKRGWGGDTSNFAVAVARLGHSVGYMCRVGDDDFGRCLLEMWKKEGIDTTHVIVEKGGYTGIYFIALLEGGRHEFVYYRKDSAASHFSPDDIDPEYIKQAKVFHTSGITQAISRSCCEASFKAIKIAKKNGVLVSYDPNVRLKLWPINLASVIIESTIRMVDVVLPSMEDAKLILGCSDPEEAADRLLKLGPKIVVIKLGERGCFVASRKERFFVPGYKVNVIDTTGSGDAFDGAFIVKVLEGADLYDAALFANIVGALTATGYGAVEPIPKRDLADKIFKEYKKKVSKCS